jgi:hypothetical protein
MVFPMNSGVKIIKRERVDGLQSSPPRQLENTPRQSDRQIAGAVKNWITELAQRKRAEQQRALILLCPQITQIE